MPIQFTIGLGSGVLIGLLAWRARALTLNGAVAAALTGGVIFGLGGPVWATLLLTFFITSSGLSRAFANRKQAVAEKYAKGSQRDWGQVAANGGLGALLAVVQAFYPGQAWPWVAFAGAMAAVNADTWATELGVFNRTPPRLVTTGKVVEKGTSGGVSWLGSLAALAGSLALAVPAWLLAPAGGSPVLVLAVTLGGLAGSFFDSFLGATVQAIYHCPSCAKETEQHPLHTCGSSTLQVRGWRWMSNDLVNFLCSMAGAGTALLFWQWIGG